MVSKEVATAIANKYGSGYWYVGDQCFFNKAEALRHATSVNKKIGYYFFDDVYKILKNGKEPTQTLDELYAERAKQLREKYDYVMLAISGGSDSMNMLYAFLNNGLKVDEIVAYYPVKAIEKIGSYDPSNTDTSNHIFEYLGAFAPQISEILKSHPEIKVTVLDFTDTALDMIGGGTLHEHHYGGLSLHPATAGPSMVFQRLKQIQTARPVCVIGVDKPRVLYNSEKDEFALFFIDLQNFWQTAAMAQVDCPPIELFYYTPDLPEIVQKQYFEVRATMKPLIGTPLYKSLRRDHATKKNIDLFNMQEAFFENLIYPSCKMHVFQANKPASLFYNTESDWLFKMKDNRLQEYYKGQMDEFIHGVDERFITFIDGKPALFTHTSTKTIYL